MASVAGSSSDAFFWVASRMKVLDRITSSSARIDFLRPTKRGAIMCGNTTMSRSGNIGKARVSPGMRGGRGLALVMAQVLFILAVRRDRPVRSHDRVPMGLEGEYGPPQRHPRPKGRYTPYAL